MGFRGFYFHVGVRIFILAAILFLLSYCMVLGLHLRAAYLAVFSIISGVELFYYLTRFTRTIKTFFIGVQQSDFTLHFPEHDHAFRDVHEALNNVIDSFKKITADRETQFRFITTLVEHLRVAVISFDDQKQIHLANNAFRKLIGVKSFEQFRFDAMQANLREACLDMRSGETKTIDLSTADLKRTYAIYASDYRVGNGLYRLRSLQDITDELSVKEMESWTKLMRVLTHEIMNSISPMVSLSDTLFKMVQDNGQAIVDETLLKSLISGLDAIRIRGNGLQQFTAAYRQLSKMPAPVFMPIHVQSMMGDLTNLLQEEFKIQHVELEIDTVDETINADRALLEQSLLNLLRNAMEACGEVINPRVAVIGRIKDGYYEINIVDNGPGIDAREMDKIFVPFFTTKKNGSGIGLAMSRQIIRLHGGDIIFSSSPGIETTFTVKLPFGK